MDTYQRIARVIRHLDAHPAAGADVAGLAVAAGVSPGQLHRLFAAWAGVTPKQFLKCLTHTHARALLRRGDTVLDAALETGLSGAGRLHDLCVTLEAATPGECRTGGAGMTLDCGVADTPFGAALIAVSPRGITHLAFLVASEDAAWAELQRLWPHARLERRPDVAAVWSERVFRRPEPRAVVVAPPPLRAWVRATAFQVQVWRALLRVPPGMLVSYGALAATMGRPGAARAVGRAVGSNALGWLIPCHRVIRETAVVGEYRWGTARKRAMIAWESAAQERADAESEAPKGRHPQRGSGDAP